MPHLTPRQQSILAAIIKEYIRHATPISSGALVNRDHMDFSPATIRNDMLDLENAGYLRQPHTSAGRVPTEQAWHWYVTNVLHDRDVSKRGQEDLSAVVKDFHHGHDELMRRLAKQIAELIRETVIVAYAPTNTYYTGLSHLFAQPEFEEVDTMVEFSRVVDRLDEVMADVFRSVGDDVQVLVGKENPFGHDCGAIIVRYAIPHHQTGVLGILGPLRQDYDEHVAVMKYAQSLLRNA